MDGILTWRDPRANLPVAGPDSPIGPGASAASACSPRTPTARRREDGGLFGFPTPFVDLM